MINNDPASNIYSNNKRKDELTLSDRIRNSDRILLGLLFSMDDHAAVLAYCMIKDFAVLYIIGQYHGNTTCYDPVYGVFMHAGTFLSLQAA